MSLPGAGLIQAVPARATRTRLAKADLRSYAGGYPTVRNIANTHIRDERDNFHEKVIKIS